MPAGFLPLPEFDRDGVGRRRDLLARARYRREGRLHRQPQPQHDDCGAELVQRRSRLVVLMRKLCCRVRSSRARGADVRVERRLRDQPRSPGRRDRGRALQLHAVRNQDATVGTPLEIRLTSDDTAHGFRIIGTNVNIEIPKRGRGTTTVTFNAEKAGRYTFECSRLCGAGHSFMRGVIVVADPTVTPMRATVFGSPARSSRLAAARRRRTALTSGAAGAAPLLPGDPLPGVIAGGVRRVPTGPRRLPGSGDQRGRARAGIQRHELRRLPQRAGGRRRQPGVGSAGRAAPGRWAVRALDAAANAVPSVLGSRPCLSAGDPAGGERHRAAHADSAVRRRAGRGD